ncbi:DNA damage-binding protein 1 isoform X2 [Tanacetum coccineum]
MELKYCSGSEQAKRLLLILTAKGHTLKKTGSVPKIKIQRLGARSVASTLSYLSDERLFVGSMYVNSQLIKVNIKPDTEGSYLEVLEEYTNLGPIIDFCVVNSGLQDQQQIVICSGTRKHASLSIVRKGILLNEHGSVEVKGITGLWSIRSAATDDLHERFMVTSNSVRLVSLTSKDMLFEWRTPNDSSICVATANASQILLATGVKHLVYIEISDGKLSLKADIELDKDVSCLDLNPPSENSSSSYYAAVGVSTDVCVKIYSLPCLDLVSEELLGGHLSPRSVLFCAFEEVMYLFCGFGDGVLLNFVLNMSTGALTNRKEHCMGNCPVTFSYKNRLHIFAISDRPAVIYSRFRKLVFVEVEQIDVSLLCSFGSVAFPDSFVVANKGVLTIGTFDDIQPVRSIAQKHEARRICHLEKSCTFALCSVQYSTKGAVYSLSLFDGVGLVAAIGKSVRLYEWKQKSGVPLYLQFVCEYFTGTCDLYVQTCGAFIIVADGEKSVSLFMYQFDTRTITDQAQAGHDKWITTVETLDERSFLGAENKLNLFSLERRGEQLEVVGQYHFGEYVNKFSQSSVNFSEVQSVIFGAASGDMGIIASPFQEQYL